MSISRQKNIEYLKANPDDWDFIIIGGGATGLGVAVDAASRGYKTVLVEQSDFAKSTSSRSTKLVHGGVRYLAQGDVSLVREALHERGRLARNAPHLVKNQKFIIANYKAWEQPFYSIGMKMYDALAGKLNIGKSKIYSKKKLLKQFLKSNMNISSEESCIMTDNSMMLEWLSTLCKLPLNKVRY